MALGSGEYGMESRESPCQTWNSRCRLRQGVVPYTKGDSTSVKNLLHLHPLSLWSESVFDRLSIFFNVGHCEDAHPGVHVFDIIKVVDLRCLAPIVSTEDRSTRPERGTWIDVCRACLKRRTCTIFRNQRRQRHLFQSPPVVPDGMFAPRHGTLKEGRSLPGLPYAGPARRGGLRSRQSTLILVGLVFFLLIWFLFYRDPAGSVPARHHVAPVSQMPPSSPSDPEVVLQTSQNDGPVQPASNEAETGPSGQISPDDQRVSKAPFQAPPEETTQRETKLVPGEQQQDKAPLEDEPAAGQPESYSPTAPIPQRPRVQSETFSERPQFEKALARVINLLPGEMEGRDLLRQVEGTGKEKLREMGLRVREYKKFFQAWEDLHLTDDPDGGTYVRDDVIQYLRQHHHHGALNPIPELGDTSIAQIIRSYEAYRYFLVKFGQLLFPWTAPYFPDHMTLHSHFKRGGRGIVLTAGDDQAHFLLTTIATFRNLGCTLPIEVMYLGDSDLSEDYRSDLEALDGVVTRDIAQMVNDEGWKLAGWAAKPFAILFSSFREAIFIDADSLFFTNPEVLFDDPSYQRTGALFFRDRLIMPESKKRWLQQILPKPISRQVKQSRFWTGDSGHMQESGVVVVDKWKHFIALLMVTRMNGPDRDGNKEEGRIGVYDMVYGRCGPMPPTSLRADAPIQVTRRPSGSAGNWSAIWTMPSTKGMPVSWELFERRSRSRSRNKTRRSRRRRPGERRNSRRTEARTEARTGSSLSTSKVSRTKAKGKKRREKTEKMKRSRRRRRSPTKGHRYHRRPTITPSVRRSSFIWILMANHCGSTAGCSRASSRTRSRRSLVTFNPI